VRYFQSVKEILSFAISLEEEVSLFYADLMPKTSSKSLRAVIKEFIRQEQNHIKTLKSLIENCDSDLLSKAINLKISNYTTPININPSDSINYKHLLSMSIKKENACFKLYTDLARLTSDANVKDTFTLMASQEAHHRLAFQREYNDKNW
jgi:rubrerythrin